MCLPIITFKTLHQVKSKAGQHKNQQVLHHQYRLWAIVAHGSLKEWNKTSEESEKKDLPK